MRGPVLGVIPARLGATRLPRKPLRPILGTPLLEWVWVRAQATDVFDTLVVATDSEEVADLCRRLGALVELTDPEHPSGTDRVAEVALKEGYRSHPVVVNLQGDEPLVEGDHLQAAVELVTDQGWEAGTCATPILDPAAMVDSDIVKVARAQDGRALYFSRAPIPWKRDGPVTESDVRGAPFLRHLGLYAFRRETLIRWAELEASPLELLERLEQLRLLEAGTSMGVAVVDAAAPGVDTPEDLARMEAELTNRGLAPPTSKGP